MKKLLLPCYFALFAVMTFFMIKSGVGTVFANWWQGIDHYLLYFIFGWLIGDYIVERTNR